MQFGCHSKVPACSTGALRSALAALLLTCAGGAVAAEAQQLRYSLTPTVQRVWWDDALGLEDVYMHGGRLGITFGEYIGLQGYYMMRDGVNTRLGEAGFTGDGVITLQEQEIDLSTYGADVMIRFGAGGFNPFLRFGGGVLRFEPQAGARSSHVVLRGGGGLRIGRPGSIQLQLSADDMMFRANRFRFAQHDADAVLPVDPEANDLRHNLVVGAGLTIPFGGTIWADDTPQWGWSDVGLPIEVFAGRLDFADDVGLARQDLVGARTGINFGRAVGLRGYYWRGVESGFDALEPIQSWGGEAQFALAQGTGLLPYLLVGAGRLQFGDDFLDPAGEPRQDRTMLIVGGGLGLDLAPGLRLNLSARDYIFSQDDLGDVTRTDQLFNNWMYSAGLSFTIGGARRGMSPARVMQRDPQVETVIVDSRTGEVVRTIPRRITEEERRRLVRDTEHTVERQRLEGRSETGRDADRGDLDRRLRADEEYLEERRRMMDERREMDRRMMDDRRELERRTMTERELERTRLTPTGRDTGYVSGRVIQVPVPTEGEIRLRYGPLRDTSEAGADARQHRTPDERGMMHHAPGQQHGQAPQQYMSPPMHGAMGAEMREAVRTVLREELSRERGFAQMGQAQPAQQAAPRAQMPARPGTPAGGGAMDARMMEDNVVNRVAQMMRAERDTVRAMVREEMRRVAFDDERERRLFERIERTVEERTRTLQPTPQVVPGTEPEAVVAEPATAQQPREPRTWSVYSGLSFGGGTQVMLGGRADLGPMSSNWQNIQLVPELGFGVLGGARSTLLAVHGQYPFGNMQVSRLGPTRPYAGLGLGLLHYSDDFDGRDGWSIQLIPAIGITSQVPGLQDFLGLGATSVMAEFQGIGFFSVNRLLVGLQFGM